MGRSFRKNGPPETYLLKKKNQEGTHGLEGPSRSRSAVSKILLDENHKIYRLEGLEDVRIYDGI